MLFTCLSQDRKKGSEFTGLGPGKFILFRLLLVKLIKPPLNKHLMHRGTYIQVH